MRHTADTWRAGDGTGQATLGDGVFLIGDRLGEGCLDADDATWTRLVLHYPPLLDPDVKEQIHLLSFTRPPRQLRGWVLPLTHPE